MARSAPGPTRPGSPTPKRSSQSTDQSRTLGVCTAATSGVRSARDPRALREIADHGDPLDLDLHAGPREVRDGDERAPRVAAIRELLLADLDEAVAVAGVPVEDRPGGEIRERYPRTPHG